MKKIITSKYEDSTISRYVESHLYVNWPEYRGAPMPNFDPNAINESEFADELRAKAYDIDIIDDSSIQLDYTSQGWGTSEDIDGFLAEVKRACDYILEEYKKYVDEDAHLDVAINLESRDGDGPVIVDLNL